MTTYSHLVDKMVIELKRPDLLKEICTYLNQTIREVHSDPRTNNIALFSDNLMEDRVIVNAEPYLWEIPRVGCFQSIQSVRYDSVFDTFGKQIYPRLMKPGRAAGNESRWVYRAGPRYCMVGCGGIGSSISLSWYEFPPTLTYFDPTCRPVKMTPYGLEYSANYVCSPESQEAANCLSTNWILLRWPMLLEEGLRAKVYKRLSDDSRAGKSYSLFQQQHRAMYVSEVSDDLGSWQG